MVYIGVFRASQLCVFDHSLTTCHCHVVLLYLSCSYNLPLLLAIENNVKQHVCLYSVGSSEWAIQSRDVTNTEQQRAVIVSYMLSSMDIIIIIKLAL